MRLKTLGNQERVYLNPHDYQTLLDSAVSGRARIAMRIMGEMGLRVSEVGFALDDVYQSTHPEVGIHFVTLYGKDTSGDSENGKRRDAWVPADLLEALEDYYDVKQKPTSMAVIGQSKRTITRDIKKTAKKAAEKTGNEDFEYVSCHDFRAYFATNMMLREGVDPEVVMELGGWEDRQTIDPYLNASFDDIIRDGLAEAGVLDIEAGKSELEAVLSELKAIKNAIRDIDPGAGDLDTGEDQSSLDGFSG